MAELLMGRYGFILADGLNFSIDIQIHPDQFDTKSRPYQFNKK
jgi:hypothetical protein